MTHKIIFQCAQFLGYFCALLVLTTNYCDVYKSISACTFVAAFNKLYCIVICSVSSASGASPPKCLPGALPWTLRETSVPRPLKIGPPPPKFQRRPCTTGYVEWVITSINVVFFRQMHKSNLVAKYTLRYSIQRLVPGAAVERSLTGELSLTSVSCARPTADV